MPSIQSLVFSAGLTVCCLTCPAFSIASDELFRNYESLLPPLQPWSGRSESLVLPEGHPWVTPSELSGLTATPDYDETIAWLKRLVEAAPELDMIEIGRSHQGRAIWMVVASVDRAFTAQKLSASGKPLLLAQAGIHSGEIDGKDAGLMLLRDMTVVGSRASLLQQANFLFIPILNVDGHENRSPFNRINQRGPEQMGWRTNSRNQNLNRDYAKLDTPGVRAVVQVINDWKPDLYLDLHVTDGADYQYDITFGGNGAGGWSPTIAAWIDGPYTQHLNRRLSEMGHIPGPLILVTNNRDTRDGYYLWTADPRYSNAYGDARHLPTILVENHSLKPYRQRVLGTYVLLEASLEALALNHEAVVDAVIQDRQRRSETVVLGFQPEEKPRPPEPFRGIRFETYQGAASGGPVTRWTGEADDTPVSPVAITRPRAQVAMPEAYLVPAQWPEVAERLALHGIPVEQLSEATTFDVEVYRLPGAKLAEPAAWTPNPFEGRVRIDPGVPEISRRTMTFPAGSYRIPTDHALGELAALLLEPLAADSFLQWGFFLEMFTRTEYAEPYVIEPLAQQMLEQDPELAREFEALLAADSEFASDPVRRLLWFYERTPFFDPGYRVYPVARLAKP